MSDKKVNKWLALAILGGAQCMVVLDSSIVNVALPALQRALGFTSDAQLQWVVTAYALLFGGFLLLGGRLADLFGRRRMFIVGVVLFAIASLLAGFAQDATMLIIWRGLQGFGGALLAPAALSSVLSIFAEGKERNKALGIWGMISAGGGAIGLVMGGLLVQYVDWRWVFFINLPIAAAVALLAGRYVPAAKPVNRHRVDIVGAATITGAVVSLVYGLVRAAEIGWGASEVMILFGVSVAALIAFIINERAVKYPLIRLGIFARRNVTGAALIQLLTSAAMFGMFFYISIYLQQLLHYTPTQTGFANLPLTFMVMVVAGILSSHIAKINPKIPLIIGSLLVGAGLLFFTQLPLEASYLIHILPGTLLLAAGMAMVFVTAVMVATSGVDLRESGLVSGILNTSQQVGGAVGLAVLTVVSTAATERAMIEAHGNPAHMPMAVIEGFHQAFIVAAGMALIAAVVALVVIRAHKPTKQEMAHEAEHEAEALTSAPGI